MTRIGQRQRPGWASRCKGLLRQTSHCGPQCRQRLWVGTRSGPRHSLTPRLRFILVASHLFDIGPFATTTCPPRRSIRVHLRHPRPICAVAVAVALVRVRPRSSAAEFAVAVSVAVVRVSPRPRPSMRSGVGSRRTVHGRQSHGWTEPSGRRSIEALQQRRIHARADARTLSWSWQWTAR